MAHKKYVYSKLQSQFVLKDMERKIEYEDMELFNGDSADESWGLLISYWRAFPDRLLDLFEADTPMYSLEIVQRLLIRIFFSYQHAFITASRGFTKSFCALTAKLLQGVLYPGTVFRYAAPTKEQMAEIATEKWEVIKKQFPGLASYWDVISNAKDSFDIRTKCGSVITISAERGSDCNGICAEEVAQEETGRAFDFDRFANAVLPTARVARKVARENDPFFPQFQKQYITSAGNQQNASFEYRNTTYREMLEGRNSVALDIPWEVAVLSGIRDAEYYRDLRGKQSPEAQLREIDSIWTGTSANPVIRDSTLTESKVLPIMESRHCGDRRVRYVLGYDVSYAEGANNAKCATAVFKLERQTDEFKRDRFLKSLVYVMDSPPPKEQMIQARQLKDRWYRFSLEGAEPTFIAIDAWQYGKGVVECLHKDLGDGLPPLCCINHEFPELEEKGALPVIYAIKATSGTGGLHDSDAEMIRYAELEFEHRNVQLLVSNIYEGIRAYKILHHIKDDYLDPTIAIPYLKTRELCGQISNLQKKVTGVGMSERRISNSIQRDMWSATKYALRLCQIIEREELGNAKRETEWSKFLASPQALEQTQSNGTYYSPLVPAMQYQITPRIQSGIRRGGNIR